MGCDSLPRAGGPAIRRGRRAREDQAPVSEQLSVADLVEALEEHVRRFAPDGRREVRVVGEVVDLRPFGGGLGFTLVGQDARGSVQSIRCALRFSEVPWPDFELGVGMQVVVLGEVGFWRGQSRAELRVRGLSLDQAEGDRAQRRKETERRCAGLLGPGA